ncbi:MAG: putative molybdopterin biosynthesis protein, partial [Urechidicola sp.]
DLLNSNKVDVSCIHWGPEQESSRRHPSLLQQYQKHHDWILIRAFKREQGLMYRTKSTKSKPTIPEIFDKKYRWSVRQTGSGGQRFLMEILSQHGLNYDELNVSATARSEREAASTVASQIADVASGTRSIAKEFGLDFISLGWEAFDFVVPRNIWFRHLFQNFMTNIKSDTGMAIANQLGGYQLDECGDLIWGGD